MYRIEIEDRCSERLIWRILEYADKLGLAVEGPGYRDERDDRDIYDFIELDGFERETFGAKLRKHYKSFRGETFMTTHIKQSEKKRATEISQFQSEQGMR